MRQDTEVGKQATSEPNSILSLEDLHPIRIGTVAHQPGPERISVVFVGLACLLPAPLRLLCSCAGLFFARVTRLNGDQYHLEVAALPHYFDADDRTRERHVRSVKATLPLFAQLLEWDRTFVGKATCDVRELVEEHVAAFLLAQNVDAPQESRPLPTAASVHEHQPVVDDTDAQEDLSSEKKGEGTEVDLQVIARVAVPHRVVLEVFKRLNITAQRERRVHTAMLIAALDTIQMQLDSPLPVTKRRQLEHEYNEIRAVQMWRRQRRDAGYSWQSVVALEPMNEASKWEMVIGKERVIAQAA